MTIRGVFFNPGDISHYPTAYSYTGNLSGITDTAVGTMSCWFRSLPSTNFTFSDQGFFEVFAGVGSDRVVFEFDISGFTTYDQINSMGEINISPFSLYLSDGVTFDTGVILTSAYTPIINNCWHHLLISWDSGHTDDARIFKATIDRFPTWEGRSSYRVNNAALTVPYSTVTEWWLGTDSNSHIGSGGDLGADLAEFWFAPGVFLDVSDPTIINKFVDTDGYPVDLGSDGSLPTGTAPLIYQSYRSTDSGATDFLTNRGSSSGVTWAIHGDAYGIVQSDVDPHIENPIRVLTGTTETVTMRSATLAALNFSGGLDAMNNAFYMTSWNFLNGIGGTLVRTPLEFSDSNLTVPSKGVAIVPHSDGLTYDQYTISPAFAGSAYWDMMLARGDTNIYTVVVDGDTVEYKFTVIPLSGLSVAPNGPYTTTTDAWMADEYNILRTPSLLGQIIRWNGQEHFAGLMDSTANSGLMVLIDSSGNIIKPQVWNGWNQADAWSTQQANAELFLLCSPDAGTGRNHFLTGTGDGWSGTSAMSVVADDSGNEISRSIVRADSIDIDSLIQGFTCRNAPFSFSPVAVNEYGFHYTGFYPEGGPVGLFVNPEATSYIKKNLVSDPGDRDASIILDAMIYGSNGFVYDGTNHWLFASSWSFTEFAVLAQSSDSDYYRESGVLLEDLSAATNEIGQIWGSYPLTKLPDSTTSFFGKPSGGVGLPNGGWALADSGSTSYTAGHTPIDPDYSVAFSVVPSCTSVNQPPDGNTMFVIGRADPSGNGYKAAVTMSGGTAHLQFQVMPSGSVIDIDMGEINIGFYVVMLMVGTSIKVAVASSGDGLLLLPDATWTTYQFLDFRGMVDSFAVEVTDSTYTDPGEVIFGGSG